MHQLFWKIFFSFWFSLILFVSVSLLAATLYLEHTRAQDEIESPRARLSSYADEARQIATSQGIDQLKSWLRQLDRREAIPFLLLDQQGEDLLNRPVSPHLAQRFQRGRKPPRHLEGRRPFRQPAPIRVPGGNHYRLVADFQAVTLGRVLRRPRVIASPIILAAIISGLVCFLLARYLTTPIRRLSRATHQFASGDFSLRVSPALGRRRDEIADLARDFDHMAERLQELLNSQKQLISDVSHELRSPLARLQVALGLARKREPVQCSMELDRIEHEAELLNEMIGQLLSLSRLESGATLQHAGAVDLSGLLNEVVKNADFEAGVLNREVRIIDCVPVSIRANETLLRSALENVVRNAVKYTNENTSVDISLQPDPEHNSGVIVLVRDHGPGVPEDMLSKLFEPFVRIGEARDRKSGGYGLGLAIAKRAVQLHGGEIRASNDVRGGLNVRIRLPVDPGYGI
jgi:two-component system sensor histidine kinase CpxA